MGSYLLFIEKTQKCATKSIINNNLYIDKQVTDGCDFPILNTCLHF